MNASSHIIQPRGIGRFGWIVFMLIGLVMVIALFTVKANALAAKAKLSQLENRLEQEHAEIRMIKAEIAHLENPERVQSLAKTYLHLEPVKAAQTLNFAQAVAQIPQKPVVDVSEEEGEQ